MHFFDLYNYMNMQEALGTDLRQYLFWKKGARNSLVKAVHVVETMWSRSVNHFSVLG